MEKQNFSQNSLWAVIKSQNSPTDEQLKKIGEFLNKKYNSDVELSFKEDNSVKNGFKIEIGTLNDRTSVDEIIDWSLEGKTRQLKNKIFEAIKNKHDVIPLIKETVDKFSPSPEAQEVGFVLAVGDGIATVSGLEHAKYGEILIFESGVKGMVLDLKEERLGCVVFGDDAEITEGSLVRRSRKTAGVPVGDAMLGRIVDALGSPIDGNGPIKEDGYYPIENKAPGIIDRQPVNKPM